jgi:hypothetical protein
VCSSDLGAGCFAVFEGPVDGLAAYLESETGAGASSGRTRPQEHNEYGCYFEAGERENGLPRSLPPLSMDRVCL